VTRKVILSRKGFDSANGGIASPIMPNPERTLLSLPIPDDEDEKNMFSRIFFNGNSYSEIISQLKPNLEYSQECHLDPDIFEYVKDRPVGWKACFGQSGVALTHLDNNKVKVGDIFLFFGWYKQTVDNNGKIRYARNAPDQHIIFGYLEVGRIARGDEVKEFDWHPHSQTHIGFPNAIYVAADHLLGSEYPGFGTFKFSKDLVLTKKGLSRSKWELPECLKNVEMTYHDINSHKEGYFQSAMIGQEFVMGSSKELEQWILSLVDINRVKIRVINKTDSINSK